MLSVEERRSSSAQKSSGLLSSLRRRSSNRKSSSKTQSFHNDDKSPSVTGGADSEPESVFIGSARILKYESSLSGLGGSGDGGVGEAPPQRRRRSSRNSSSSSGKSHRQGLVMSDAESLAVFSHESTSLSTTTTTAAFLTEGHRHGGGVRVSSSAAVSSSLRVRSQTAISDDEFIRSRGNAQPWASSYDALFSNDRVLGGRDSIDDSGVGGGPDSHLPRGYRHHRKAPPPPPPLHRPPPSLSGGGGDLAAGADQLLQADHFSDGRFRAHPSMFDDRHGQHHHHHHHPAPSHIPSTTTTTTATSPQDGFDERDQEEAGDGGGDGDGPESDPESVARKQAEVMAALSAFRCMGSKEVRATALQIGNVLHSPKKPDLSAKPLKSALKKTVRSNSGGEVPTLGETAVSPQPQAQSAVSPPPPPPLLEPPVSPPLVVKQGSVWRQTESQWVACGVTVLSGQEPAIYLSISNANAGSHPGMDAVSIFPKDVLSVQQTQGTSSFDGGYFTLQTEAELHTFAVPGKDDSGALEWVTAINGILSEAMMSSVPSHPVQSSSSITSIQESGYGSASQDTLEKCCSPSSEAEATVGKHPHPGALTPDEVSADMTSLRAQLSAKLSMGHRDVVLETEEKQHTTPSPLSTDPTTTMTLRASIDITSQVDLSLSASSLHLSAVPSIQLNSERLASTASVDDDDDDDDEDDDDEHRLSASMPAGTKLKRTMSSRSSMRFSLHSQVAIPAPVTKPTYQTYRSQSPGIGGGQDVDEYDGPGTGAAAAAAGGNLALSQRNSFGVFLDEDKNAFAAGAGANNGDGTVGEQAAAGGGDLLAVSAEPGGSGLSGKKGSRRGWLTVRLTKKEKEEQQKKIKTKRKSRSTNRLDNDDDDDDDDNGNEEESSAVAGGRARNTRSGSAAPSAFLPPMATIVPVRSGVGGVGEKMTFTIRSQPATTAAGSPTPTSTSPATAGGQSASSPPPAVSPPATTTRRPPPPPPRPPSGTICPQADLSCAGSLSPQPPLPPPRPHSSQSGGSNPYRLSNSSQSLHEQQQQQAYVPNSGRLSRTSAGSPVRSRSVNSTASQGATPPTTLPKPTLKANAKDRASPSLLSSSAKPSPPPPPPPPPPPRPGKWPTDAEPETPPTAASNGSFLHSASSPPPPPRPSKWPTAAETDAPPTAASTGSSLHSASSPPPPPRPAKWPTAAEPEPSSSSTTASNACPKHSASSSSSLSSPPVPVQPDVLPVATTAELSQFDGGEQLSGLLWRQEADSLLWKKLLMHLRDDHVLKLFSAENMDAGKPPIETVQLGTISMVNRILDMDGVAQEERFELVAHDNTSHLFSASSVGESQRWIGALSDGVYRAQKMQRKEQRRIRRQASVSDALARSSAPSSQASSGGNTPAGGQTPGNMTPAGSQTPGTSTPPVVASSDFATGSVPGTQGRGPPTHARKLPRKISVLAAMQHPVVPGLPPKGPAARALPVAVLQTLQSSPPRHRRAAVDQRRDFAEKQTLPECNHSAFETTV